MSWSYAVNAASILSLNALATAALLGQTAEITTKDSPFTFRSGVNMVPVPVVVRDKKGNAIGGLGIEDFQLFDNGKPQAISKFSVEKIVKDAPAAPAVASAPKPATALYSSSATALTGVNPDDIPDRFVAYLFDDLHMSLSDLVYTRNAAKRQIDSTLNPLSRTAIYTTSALVMQEFTGDRDKLHAALAAISTGQAAGERTLRENSCPPVDYYMGDLIYNKSDYSAWKIATKDALSCSGLGTVDVNDPNFFVDESQIRQCDASPGDSPICAATRAAKRAAREAVLNGDRLVDTTLDTIRAVVARMAAMPGQRDVVVISPGFLVLDDRRDQETAIIERAIKANVVIGGLDARGLYTLLSGGDASTRNAGKTLIERRPFDQMAAMLQTEVLSTLAHGTGGAFYAGTNDMDEGLRRVAAAPDYIYVLGFTPLDLKPDGRYHNLKAVLRNRSGFDLQVRKGYYAPRSSGDPADQAKLQIEEAFFSREAIQDLPATLQTQYFKRKDGDATLSAVTKVDVKKLAYRKDGERNRNDLTIVTGVFDNDGNFVNAERKVLEMQLLDETLVNRLDSGISVKSSFTVHSGRYVVRMVVRDSEGQTMSAQSSMVEIP